MGSKSLLKNILRKEGLRYTFQRQAVWNELESSADHRDAEDIYLRLCRKKFKYPGRQFTEPSIF